MIIANAQVFIADGFFEKKHILIKDSIISDVIDIVPDNELSKKYPEEHIINAQGHFAIPGLTDMHFHGCNGHDFCEGTEEAFKAISTYEAREGITAICPATMTLNKQTLMDICSAAAAYHQKQKDEADSCSEEADLLGINLEGPFISPQKKGAQNPQFICNPDIETFRDLYKASKGLVRTIALAPEMPDAMDFIRELKDETVISIAHTMADYDTARSAFESGARHVTHLYNAMPPFSHRAPGVIGAACENDQCHVELICDGIHIHPATVRTTFKMFGDKRIILISDSMEATGMPDGQYALGGLPVTVKGNLAVLQDGTIAGSATNLMDCVRIAVKSMGIPLASAITCAAVNPAKEIGIYDRYGSIDTGKFANIVLLDSELNTACVILKGKVIKKST